MFLLRLLLLFLLLLPGFLTASLGIQGSSKAVEERAPKEPLPADLLPRTNDKNLIVVDYANSEMVDQNGVLIVRIESVSENEVEIEKRRGFSGGGHYSGGGSSSHSSSGSSGAKSGSSGHSGSSGSSGSKGGSSNGNSNGNSNDAPPPYSPTDPNSPPPYSPSLGSSGSNTGGNSGGRSGSTGSTGSGSLAAGAAAGAIGGAAVAGSHHHSSAHGVRNLTKTNSAATACPPLQACVLTALFVAAVAA